MVSSSSSYTETSTKLGLGISQPKSPHGIVRDWLIVWLKPLGIFSRISNIRIYWKLENWNCHWHNFHVFSRDEVIQVTQLSERCNKHQWVKDVPLQKRINRMVSFITFFAKWNIVSKRYEFAWSDSYKFPDKLWIILFTQ